MEHEFYECPYIGNVIIQLTLIFFRGVETTNQIGYVYRLYGMRVFMCASMLKGIVCSSLLIYSHHIFGRAGNYLVWGLELGSLRPEHKILEDSGGPIGPILLLPGLSSNRDRQFQWCELMFIHIHSQKKHVFPFFCGIKLHQIATWIGRFTQRCPARWSSFWADPFHSVPGPAKPTDGFHPWWLSTIVSTYESIYIMVKFGMV